MTYSQNTKKVVLESASLIPKIAKG